MKNADRLLFPVLGLFIGFFVLSGPALAQSTPDTDVAVASLETLRGSPVRHNPNPPVTLELNQVLLQKALKRIAGQAEAGLYYNAALVPDKTVSLQLKAVPLGDALRKVLVGTSLKVTTSGRNIILRQKKGVYPMPISLTQNQETITGTVTGAQSGQTLPGVNIRVKGTTTGTSTDANGEYELTVESLQDTLVFSFVGYQEQNVPINGQTEIDIILQPQAIAGEELVVVGYGEMEREDVTSSISSVDGEDLETSTTSSFTQGLQGKVAGMTAIQETGQPGGGMNIKIRDNPSFASSGVLYVVDGVPINESAGEASTNTQYNNFNVNRSPLNFINPNDIESIEILKDASATAIYGARAGAGVVLITTKDGTSGETSVNYNVNYSIQEAANFYNMLDSREYMRERNRILKDAWMRENNIAPYGPKDASMADQFVPMYSEQEIGNTTNRQSALDAITEGGMVGQHNLSISGGTSGTTYYISGNYMNQDGILRQTGFKKYGGRVKVNTSFSDQIQGGINVNFNKSDADNPMAGGEGNASEAGMIRAAFQYPANIPLVSSDGSYPTNPDLPLASNPVSFIEIDDQTENTRLLTTAHITWNILSSLEVKGQFSYDRSTSKRGTYLPKSFLYGSRRRGFASRQEQGSNSKSMEGTVRYSKPLGENMSLNLLGGVSIKETNFDKISGQNSNYVTDIFSYHNMSAGRSNVVVSTSRTQSIWASQFGRATFNWENFNLSASVRRDGASNFAENNKYGIFPSVSAGYDFANDAFIQNNLEFIDMLKPRIGYGHTGNSNIGSNAFSIYSTGSAANNFYHNYVFGTQENVGVYWKQVENENLTWETVKDLNVGLDFAFFNNRIDGSVEYYNKTIDDLLSFRPLPTDFPVSTVADNVGKTRTTGWEININTTNISSATGDGFGWNSNFTLSHYSSSWVKRSPSSLATLEPYVDPDGPFDAVYGYELAGLYKGEEEPPSWMPGIQPGTLIVKDINGYDDNGNLTGEPDGQITEADQTLIGESDPKLSFGINNTFQYKQFDLTINAYGLLQNKYNGDLSRSYGVEGQLGINGANILEYAAKNRWSYNNQDANYPSGLSSRYDGYGGSNFWFVNANFIRIDKIELGYRMPPSLLSKQNVVSSAKINVSVENPFVFTSYEGPDPELDSFMSYPMTKGFIFGLNLTF